MSGLDRDLAKIDAMGRKNAFFPTYMTNFRRYAWQIAPFASAVRIER